MKLNFRSNYDSFPPEYGNGKGTVKMFVDNYAYYIGAEDKGSENAVALLVEPRAIIPGTYYYVEENYDKFKYIFTFDSKLLKLPNAKLLLYGQITAEFPNDPKTKNISMVASDKDACEGHIQRRRVAETLSKEIDTYGKFNGGSYCSDEDYLKGYRFNVAMENFSDGYYFTEKICNCLASRTVPIYWGCPHIGEFFNMNGIIGCESPQEVIETVRRINQNPVEEYEKRKDAIEDNFNRVQKYRRYATLFLETYGGLLEEIAK